MKHLQFKAHSSRVQSGASLIEALVSILILSLGLLGLAGLQLNALAFQKSSWATNRVAELTGDIAERIRSNPGATYAYIANYSTASTASPSISGCRTSGTCNADQIALDDIGNWIIKAQTSLPGGAAMLQGDLATGFTVTAMYRDKDFVDPITGAPSAAVACSAGLTGFEWRNCCPTPASAPPGTRCSRTFVLVGRT